MFGYSCMCVCVCVYQLVSPSGTKAGKEFAKSTTFFANLQERAAQDQRDAAAGPGERARKRSKATTEGATGSKYKL